MCGGGGGGGGGGGEAGASLKSFKLDLEQPIHRMQIWRTFRAARGELREVEASWASIKASLTSHVSFDIFRQFRCFCAMSAACCIPECNQKGVKSPTGEKVSFFEFPKQPLIKKQWIHAIRRDEGKNWQITRTTKVCSLHFRSEDLRKSLNGRLYLIANGVPSRFAWSVPSPRKRKAPTERTPLPSSSRVKKQLITPDKISETETPQAIPQDSQCKTTSTNSESRNINETWNPVDERKQIEDLEVKLLQAQGELTNLREGHSELKRKLAERERQLEAVSSRLLSLDRFRSDADINFYTGLPSYATFMCIFEFLNPGEDGENIRPRISSDVPEELYNSDSDEEKNMQETKRGRRRKLRPVEEFFIVLCRLRRGFSERHIANLYGVAQSTVSRIFIPWINFMYLKFGQVCIWPSKAAVQETMPADFKEKFPSTRVIIDCTEVFTEMPSSLLLNSELFSSYKNHVTLKALVGISPDGAITFISQLYTGSISDGEIVLRSGLLSQAYEHGDAVMADKGFQIQDILPLGVGLNIPPFLGGNSQMSAEDVVRTQQIASLRIHVERAINKIKNFHIWDGVIP